MFFDGGEQTDFVTCAHCGDRIGVYEPMWIQDAHGNVTRTGGPEARPLADQTRAFHAGCLSPDGSARS